MDIVEEAKEDETYLLQFRFCCCCCRCWCCWCCCRWLLLLFVAAVVDLAVAVAVLLCCLKPVRNDNGEMTVIPNWFMNSCCC